jgi:hypothetical protein
MTEDHRGAVGGIDNTENFLRALCVLLFQNNFQTLLFLAGEQGEP